MTPDCGLSGVWGSSQTLSLALIVGDGGDEKCRKKKEEGEEEEEEEVKTNARACAQVDNHDHVVAESSRPSRPSRPSMSRRFTRIKLETPFAVDTGSASF